VSGAACRECGRGGPAGGAPVGSGRRPCKRAARLAAASAATATAAAVTDATTAAATAAASAAASAATAPATAANSPPEVGRRQAERVKRCRHCRPVCGGRKAGGAHQRGAWAARGFWVG